MQRSFSVIAGYMGRLFLSAVHRATRYRYAQRQDPTGNVLEGEGGLAPPAARPSAAWGERPRLESFRGAGEASPRGEGGPGAGPRAEGPGVWDPYRGSHTRPAVPPAPGTGQMGPDHVPVFVAALTCKECHTTTMWDMGHEAVPEGWRLNPTCPRHS